MANGDVVLCFDFFGDADVDVVAYDDVYAAMCSQYSWRKVASLAVSYGSLTLIPLYPSLSPSPPATSTNATFPDAAC